MKRIKEIKIDIVQVLGALGLILAASYFLFINLGGEPPESNGPRGEYSLFYKLYNNLGYRLKELPMSALPKQRGDVLICFDRDLDNEALEEIIEEWVKPGGALFIAGITNSEDPLSSIKVNVSRINSIYARNRTGLKYRIFEPKGEFLKHLAKETDLSREKVLLDSEQGPLLYKTTKGAGSVFVLTDSDLLKNSYLKEENVAIIFNDLLKPYYWKRIYLIWPAGTGSSVSKEVPVLALLFRDKMVFITLQLIWVMMLFILWQGTRFGEPQLLDPYRKRTLSEHLNAVANFYQKTNSIKIIDQINLEYFIFKLNKITGRRFKSSPQPEELKQIVEYLENVVPGLSPNQIKFCFSMGENQLPGQVQAQEKLRRIILKSLTKRRTRSSAV